MEKLKELNEIVDELSKCMRKANKLVKEVSEIASNLRDQTVQQCLFEIRVELKFLRIYAGQAYEIIVSKIEGNIHENIWNVD